MNRARKLLKACKQLNNSPAAIISQALFIIMIILIITCISNNLYVLYSGDLSSLDETSNLSILSMAVVFLCIRSIYTGFFEDKRQGTKNNLKALTIHLPVSRKDFILAQYLESIYLCAPIFILMGTLLGFNLVIIHTTWYLWMMALMIILFSVTYCLISLEKGILIHYYMDPRVREFIYLVLAFIWLAINYLVENNGQKVIEEAVNSRCGLWIINQIIRLSSWGGYVCLIIAGIVGYSLSVKVPLLIERRK